MKNIKIYLTCILLCILFSELKSHFLFDATDIYDIDANIRNIDTNYESNTNIFTNNITYNITHNINTNVDILTNYTTIPTHNYAVKNLLGNRIDDLFDDNIDQINFLKSFGVLIRFFIGLQIF